MSYDSVDHHHARGADRYNEQQPSSSSQQQPAQENDDDDDADIVIGAPEVISARGCAGERFWVFHRFRFTGDAEIDGYLSSFPVCVFLPPSCYDPACARPDVPIVYMLQGLAAPLQGSYFSVPPLVAQGMVVVLLDVPLGGDRTMTRSHSGNAAIELYPMMERGATLDASFLSRGAMAVRRDLRMVHDEILAKRYGLRGGRVALVGHSLGCVFAGGAFVHDGFGERMLGVVGHLDLPRFAASYAGEVLPLIASTPIGSLAQVVLGSQLGWPAAWIPLLKTLKQLIDDDSELRQMLSPADHAAKAGNRRLRILVGDEDPCVKVEDARKCAAMFANGDVVVCPGLNHGFHRNGSNAWERAVCDFLMENLSDWFPAKPGRTATGFATAPSKRAGEAGLVPSKFAELKAMQMEREHRAKLDPAIRREQQLAVAQQMQKEGGGAMGRGQVPSVAVALATQPAPVSAGASGGIGVQKQKQQQQQQQSQQAGLWDSLFSMFKQ